MKRAWQCFETIAVFAVLLAIFSSSESDRVAWAFLVVTAVFGMILAIITFFMILNLLDKHKAYEEKQNPRFDPPDHRAAL